ncbi:MAG: GldG family protein [Oligoflexia bacterium]|nr:GldG family protein [Oligoflexia bacterium]
MKIKKYETLILISLSICAMIFAIYTATTVLKRAKVDLSDDRLYSLSHGTQEILKKLNTPITLKLYYSRTAASKGTEGLRQFNSYYQYIRDLLSEYVSKSRNNLKLEIIDPRPDTEEEESAMASGLKKFYLTDTESYFFGLVASNESGSEKAIEFFDPAKQESVEYEISKLIYNATNPQKKTIGLMTLLPIEGDINVNLARMIKAPINKGSVWTIQQFIEDFYKIKKIPLNEERITGVDMLLIMHPQKYSDKIKFAIDQYILGGGKALILVDPKAVSASSGNPFAKGEEASELTSLFATWGIDYAPAVAAGDKSLAVVGQFSADQQPQRLLPVMKCDRRCMENKEIISSGLNNLLFVFPGALTAKEVKGLTHSAIVTTTQEGGTYAVEDDAFMSPEMLWRNFRSNNSKIAIGYKIQGRFPSAYPNGPPADPAKKSEEAATPPLKEASKDGAVVIIADVDFISNQFAFSNTQLGVSTSNQNAFLLLNALDNLAGPSDLLTIRSNGRFNRNFDVIEDIEKRAESKTKSKVDEINNSIQQFTQELLALGQRAGKEGENIALIQNQGIQKRKELNKKIADLKKELRDVKREGREKIEILGKFFQYLNTLFVPAVIIVVGLVNFNTRRRKSDLKMANADEDENEEEDEDEDIDEVEDQKVISNTISKQTETTATKEVNL